MSDYGSFDEEDALAVITPVRRLQQRTLFGEVADVQVSPGEASYSSRERRRDEPATHHELDLEAIKTWVYPTNYTQRDYQYNMIVKALYTNVLIALPTGLGKTFIAAVVMYNWYRWAPKSKIVFLAPTKPLVTQQIEACYKVCGIPARDIAELTGGVVKAKRLAAYQQRRVFFLTPQTLQSDLRNELISPKEISCLVVDEAHHATGNYAYVDVVRQMRLETEGFRILALTATPGKSVETVQEVVDGLCISQIEIRNEGSIDIATYVHSKEIDTVVLDLTPEMESIQTKFAALLKPMIQRLTSMGVGMTGNATKLSAFAVREAVKRMQMQSRTSGNQNGHAAHAVGAILSSLAYQMEMLNTHGVRPFYDAMVDLKANVKSSEYKKRVVNNSTFSSMMSEMREALEDPEYTGHPKLDYLTNVILDHFQQAAEDGNTETRAMVFSSLRVSAEVIVSILKRHSPLIKPTPFYGQSAGKAGTGMTQREQLDTINKFKKGTFNVIVATSVGEEGLDIGEIDLIICYDTSSSPSRMLQRMGRTGRKRHGRVFVLCLRGREETAFLKAKDSHRVMQKKIEKGVDIVLKPAYRIIPWNVTPVCEKRLLLPPENDNIADRTLKTARKVPKRVMKQHTSGFVTAASLHCEEIYNPESTGLLTAAEQDELDQRFRLGHQSDACQAITRLETGIFLDAAEIRASSVEIKPSEGTLRLLALRRRLRKPRLEADLQRWRTCVEETGMTLSEIYRDQPRTQIETIYENNDEHYETDPTPNRVSSHESDEEPTSKRIRLSQLQRDSDDDSLPDIR